MFIILFLFIPISSKGVLGNNKTVDSSSVIQVKDSLLTVKVKDTPLKKVLMEIANQVPIKIVSYVSTEEFIVSDFSRLPMAKGLERLLRDYNHVYVHGTEKPENGEHEISKVIITSKTGENQHREAKPKVAFTEGPSLESLSKDLHDEDPSVRKYALDSFKELEDESSIDLLTEVLINDEDKDVRMSAADALGDIGEDTDIRAIRALEGALSDEDVDIRMSAVYALGSIGSEIAIDSLREALQDEDVDIRMGAVGALGIIGGDRAVRALLEDALLDEDEDLREFTVEVIGWLEVQNTIQ